MSKFSKPKGNEVEVCFLHLPSLSRGDWESVDVPAGEGAVLFSRHFQSALWWPALRS